MRNLAGLVLILCGTGLLWSGWAHRAGIRANEGRAAMNPSLAAFGEIVRPLIYVALGWLALKASLAYALFDEDRMFSPFDLAGFLYLLAAYGAWLHLRTSIRAADARAVPHREAHVLSERLMPDGSRADRPRGTPPGARDRAGAGRLVTHPAPPAEAARRNSQAA